jgi:hypothetical protein
MKRSKSLNHEVHEEKKIRNEMNMIFPLLSSCSSLNTLPRVSTSWLNLPLFALDET